MLLSNILSIFWFVFAISADFTFFIFIFLVFFDLFLNLIISLFIGRIDFNNESYVWKIKIGDLNIRNVVYMPYMLYGIDFKKHWF